MSITTEARKAVRAKLLEATGNVYYGQAPEDAAFPYAIFTLETVSKSDLVALCELEVNVVDHSRDSSTCESICDTIEQLLDHEVISTDAVLFEPLFERKNAVSAEDRAIVRRRMTFSFNLYGR